MMNRTPVGSSNIASVGYENGTLEIAFMDGGLYQYLDVPEPIFNSLMQAYSKGKFFHAYIKNCYRTIRLG